jgi:hypothetical protein
MKRYIISMLILLVLGMAAPGCASSRKHDRRLTSLMLQDNTKLGRNRAYYSKHNKKVRKDAHRNYKKKDSYRKKSKNSKNRKNRRHR